MTRTLPVGTTHALTDNELRDALSGAAAVANHSSAIIRELIDTRDDLVKALEAILAEHDRVPFSVPTMPCIKNARSVLAKLRGERCPRCDSHDPALHPAVQYGGEVQICPHAFHSRVKQGG